MQTPEMVETTTIPDIKQVEKMLDLYVYEDTDDKLDEAIVKCSAALQQSFIASDLEGVNRWSIPMATALRLRFERDSAKSDIEEALRILQACTMSHGPSSVSSMYHYALGRVLETMSDCEISSDGYELALESYQRSKDCMVAADGFEHQNRGFYELVIHQSRALAMLRLRRGPSRRSLDLITEAIETMETTVQCMEASDPFKAVAISYLSSTYGRRWYLGDQLVKQDLLKNFELSQKSLLLLRSLRQRCLGFDGLLRAASVLFSSGAGLKYINEAIQEWDQFNQLFQQSQLQYHGVTWVMANLSCAYRHRFEATGHLEDMDRAINCSQIAISASPWGRSSAYRRLSGFLAHRFEETGRLSDIDDAIQTAQRALDDSQPTDCNAYAVSGMMGCAIALRFIHFSDPEDFRNAKSLLETSILAARANRAIPEYHSLLNIYMKLLAGMCMARFRSHHEADDLTMAIELMRQAITNMNDGDSERSSFLSELGEYLALRFEFLSTRVDLLESITVHKIALGAALPQASDRHLMLWRHGCALRLKFKMMGRAEDYTASIDAFHDALRQAQATKHPKEAVYLYDLAVSFASQPSSSCPAEPSDAALAYFVRAAETCHALLRDRFQAAIDGARYAQDHGRLREATHLFSIGVSLLPKLAWIGLPSKTRRETLTAAMSQLACDAAASAIMCGAFERAVELLEEGRSVFWQSLLQLRVDMTELQSRAPDLAEELSTLSQELGFDNHLSAVYSEGRSQRRRRAAERWDVLVHNVRQLPGFESFLKPRSFSELSRAAENGAIIILNVSTYRSDAIIVTEHQPVRCVPLPDLGHRTIWQLSYLLVNTYSVAKDALGCDFLEKILLDISRRLWANGLSAVADAVMEHQKTAPPDLPRVWWIPTGLFGLLPIHCAGPYEAGQKGLQDLFISSYSTTLSALLDARTSRSVSCHSSPAASVRILGVSQPEAHGLPYLGCAREELDVLVASPFLETIMILHGSNATVQNVQRALTDMNWIHWCCHGHWNPFEPLESGFHLSDGTFSLGNILQMRLTRADFAFLSACHTARHAGALPDESIHIAAALQVAGVRGVLATQWAMWDSDGPLLAREFYGWLTAGEHSLDAVNAAEALHHAVSALRAAGLPMYRWATFVHMGI